MNYQEYPNRRFFDSENHPLEVQVLDETEEQATNSRLRQLIRFDRVARLTVAADVRIPAFGYTVIYCDNLQNVFYPQEKDYGHRAYFPPHRLLGSQMTNHHCMDNGALIVELNEKGLLNVTKKITGHVYRDLHLLEDRSDVGEGWNWRPARYDQIIYNVNSLSQFSVLADGPLCTVWKLVYDLSLPVKADPSLKRRSEEEHMQRVTTLLTLPKDSEVLYFKTEVINETENHRMRVLFPTGLSEEHFYTKTPFDFAKWNVKPEDNTDCEEPDTLVHPSQGISRIGDGEDVASLYTKGLYEVEVTDNQEKALAVTLFRAAQSETGTAHPKDIQMKRSMTFEYALSLASQSGTETILEGERYRAGLQEFRFEQNQKAETMNGSGSFLKLSENHKIISHVSERNGSFTLRLYDISGIDL